MLLNIKNLFLLYYRLGYRETKKERPPFLPGEKQPEPEKRKIPQELLCHICEDLCVDAAIAPCCGTSFCDECKLFISILIYLLVIQLCINIV